MKKGLDLLIWRVDYPSMAQSAEHPSCIGIHHKNRSMKGIQQDGICRLWSNSFNSEDFCPERNQIGPKERMKIQIGSDEICQKTPKPIVFHVIVSGRCDALFHNVGRRIPHRSRLKQRLLFESVDRLGNIGPIGILREHRSGYDFEKAVTRPPVLRFMMVEKNIKKIQGGYRILNSISHWVKRGVASSLWINGVRISSWGRPVITPEVFDV